MNRIVLLMVVSMSAQVNSCMFASSSHHATMHQTASYTKIIVLLPGKVSKPPDDNVLKIIINPTQISNIAEFVHEQLDSKAGWRAEWDGVSLAPAPFLQLLFYQEKTQKLDFGIGGSSFFSTVNSNEGYKIRRVAEETWKELLGLIEVTEEEFNKLLSDRTKPGPWKKNK